VSGRFKEAGVRWYAAPASAAASSVTTLARIRLRASARLFVLALVALAGCGQSARMPTRLPPGAVAIVATTPIMGASLAHWRAVVAREEEPSGSAGASRHAAERALSFLIKAQWLQQEARAESLNLPPSGDPAVGRVAGSAHQEASLTGAELQARLDAIASALARHHAERIPSPTRAAVVAYYSAHRSHFTEPAVRHTLMVVTRTRAAALAAATALRRGAPWARVARRFSIDPSARTGAAVNIVRGLQSPALTGAVFAAPARQVTGPVRAPRAAGPSALEYYVFEVTGEIPAAIAPLRDVEGQILGMIRQSMSRRALGDFVRRYERRWRGRTLCAAALAVPQCGHLAR